MNTEQKARELWCPMVRLDADGVSSGSLNTRDRDDYNCIASNCAMWRWNPITCTGNGEGD